MSFFNFRNFTSKARTKKTDSPSASPTFPQYPFFNSRSPLPSPGLSSSQNSTKLLYLTPPFVGASLVKGNFTPIVALPRFIDVDEWMASNLFDFFYYLNTFYGTLSDFCTPRSCPVMSADAGIEYPWVDAQKRTHRLPASQHIDLIMTSLEKLLADETIFPTKAGNFQNSILYLAYLGVPFPSTFNATAQSMARQMFRVYAHLFHSHYPTILHLGSEGHFNSQFAHFTAFCRTFQLLTPKDFTPLAELIAELELKGMF